MISKTTINSIFFVDKKPKFTAKYIIKKCFSFPLSKTTFILSLGITCCIAVAFFLLSIYRTIYFGINQYLRTYYCSDFVLRDLYICKGVFKIISVPVEMLSVVNVSVKAEDRTCSVVVVAVVVVDVLVLVVVEETVEIPVA